jgi:hypothetical protein
MTVTSVLNQALKEGFANNNVVNSNNNNNVKPQNTNMLALLVMLIVYFVLVLLVGKYLWNECLCKVVTICKPINNVFTLLGVIFIIDMLHPRL